jgi:hypothetical protein
MPPYPIIMNPDQKILDLEAKINQIYVSVEKTRKYLLWTMIITVVVLVLPIIGLMFAIPSFLSQLDVIQGLGI